LDVEREKQEAVADLSSLVQQTPLLLHDLLHLVGFGKQTLGRPLLMTPEYLQKVGQISQDFCFINLT
jgi:predicted Zn-dependent peptidase